MAATAFFAGADGILTAEVAGVQRCALPIAAANVQALAQGQVVHDVFNYAASDGLTSTGSTLDIAITGTNDAPVVTADGNAVQEDVVASASGNVLSNDSDVDAGTVLHVAAPGTFAGTYGTLTMGAD